MRVTVEFRRPSQRVVLLITVVAVLSFPSAALASHLFWDVTADNPFHDDISAIAEAGITAGFDDGGYHPADKVTRQSMAAFMRRGFGRVAFDTAGVPMTPSVTADAGYPFGPRVPVRQVTITVPGVDNASGPEQMVFVQGRVTFVDQFDTSHDGCPCQIYLVLHDLLSGEEVIQVDTIYSPTSDVFSYNVGIEGLFVAPSGPRTYELQAQIFGRSEYGPVAELALSSRSTLTAMTFPFDHDG